jgi:hypothetical protein
MFSHSKLSKVFWGETRNIMVHLINLLSSYALDGDVSEQVWSDKDVSYAYL